MEYGYRVCFCLGFLEGFFKKWRNRRILSWVSIGCGRDRCSLGFLEGKVDSKEEGCVGENRGNLGFCGFFESCYIFVLGEWGIFLGFI